MKNTKKLTSVHVLEDTYKKFKVNAIESGINLQKLVNVSLDLYNKDENFRKTVHGQINLSTNIK
jgi:hypothetical protein